MAENTTNLGNDGAPGATPASAPKTTPPATTAGIGERLSKSTSTAAQETTEGPRASEPAPAIDFSKLTQAQLQQLKAMMNATPDSVSTNRKNPIVSLRRYRGYDAKGREFGGIIVDHQNAYNTLVHNKETNITSEVVMMKVKFLGSDEWVAIPWREFIEADQVKCEVIKSSQEKGTIVEGEPIVSKETGQLVERVITTVKELFTLKLPDGEEITIEGRIANA